ncbi:hypothetical protein BZA77DRAFT_360218 [Pyronema omphalodes]|nr:hypothetical protein BZA77DRAFT_360218 [Pyronema omphalodes]
MTNTDSHDSRSSIAPGDGLTSLGGPSLRSENVQAPQPTVDSSSSISEASEASDSSNASNASNPGDASDAGHPINHPDESPTADEIISMSDSGIEKLVVGKLIERVKGRLAIVAAETADQTAEVIQNCDHHHHHHYHQQQQQDAHHCGADDCVCPQEGVQGNQAVLSESSELVDAAGFNEQNEDEEDRTVCDVTTDSDDDDILWDWSGGIWI